MMKRVWVIGLLLMSLPVFSQNLVSSFLQDIDKRAKESVIQINISGKMLQIAARSDANLDADTRKMFENINQISIVIGVAIDNESKKQLEKRLVPYEELMSIVEGSQTILMYTKETKKQIDEFVLSISAGNKLTLMSISGKIDLEQIAQLSKGIKVEGVHHLNKINPKKNK